MNTLPNSRAASALLVAIAGLTLAVSGSLGAGRSASPNAHGDPHAAPSAAPAAAPAKKPTPPMPATGDAPATKPATKPVVKPESKPDAHGDTKPAAPASGKAPARPAPKAEEPAEPIDADAALALLAEGNKRWMSGKPEAPNATPARRERLAAEGQKPFALVLTCADSRLPAERIFDRGVGDVFTVRVAGNVAGGSELGSAEYAVGHLKPAVMVVMGHTKCGAVAAAASGAEVHGSVRGVVAAITPAVERARRNNPGVEGAELVELAVRENVWQTVYDTLRNSSEIREAVRSGKLRLVGAVYDLSTGEVKWMGEHPWQAELLTALSAPAAGAPAQATAAPGGH